MRSIDGLNETESVGIPLLDVSCISEGQKLDCLAFVQSCNVKTSRIGKPFATFYLKDRNATMIAARLFDIGEAKNITSIFARHPVHVVAEVQVYNGSYSLVINGDQGITIYNGDFDYESFVGHYDVDLTEASMIYNRLTGKQLPVSMYTSVSIEFLGSGKVGAFAKIFDMALSNILFVDGVTGIEQDILLEVFFTVMHNYYLILHRYHMFGPLEKLMLHEEYSSVDCEKDKRYIVIDTLRSLCENTKPLHLYSHIIFNAVTQANKTLQLVDANNSLVAGGTTRLYFTDMLGGSTNGGVELLKY